MSTVKTTGAQIVRPTATELIRLVGYSNPEIILPEMIQTFFNELGYMEKYPYFKTLRIGAIHPFALLLYQETVGQTMDLNLFPSITVSDTSDAESHDTLGDSYNEVMLSDIDVALLEEAVLRGNILTSNQNIIKLKEATKNGAKAFSKINTFRATHNIDLNIWADNKDMVSLIYDSLKHCILANKNNLKEKEIYVEGSLNGRRSGDINVEFGKLLYGANITISATIETKSMVVDLPILPIAAGGISIGGTFHVEGEI